MDYHHCRSLILGLTSFLLISFSTAEEFVEADILVKLSKSISPTPSNWYGNSFCNWTGIGCDSYDGKRRVVAIINLPHMSLTGTLPSDLNSLRYLVSLRMQGNSLSGPLPTLSNLAFLEQVILDGNNFTSIPSDFLYGLFNLEILSISDNLQLSPWSLLNNLSDCIYLQSFQAGNANIHGPLPTLSNLASLEQVILDGNNFTSIPSDLFYGLTSLQSFSISDNLQLSPWSLPIDLINSTNLRTFQANQANINGTIPDFFYWFPKLQNLSLSYNNLTGSLPASFRESQIQNLRVNNQIQGLSGTIDVLSSMTHISQVWLEGNAFTGTIPDLSKCTLLFDLQLGDNRLTGLVPVSIMSLPKLANINLWNNKLQGPLPVFGSGVTVELGANCFCLDKPGKCDAQATALLEVAGSLGYPMSLAESWFGDDVCDGRWEFVVCNSNNRVTSVNFAKQNFSGTISPAFGNLTSLRMLLLNDNNLTGSIPDVLTSLPDLQLLNVSNNNLSGLVPVFPTRVKFSSDNNFLLGKRIINENINTTDSKSSSGGSVGLVIGIVISGVIFVIGVILFVLVLWI